MKIATKDLLKIAIRTTLLFISATLPFSIKVNSVCIILCTVAVIVDFICFPRTFKIQHPLLALAMIGTFLMHVFSILYSSDTREGWFEVEKKLSLIVFPLIILSQKEALTGWTKYILLGFSLSTVTFLSIHLLKLHYHNPLEKLFFVEENGFNLRRAFDMYYQIHPTYLSLYLAFSACIFLYYYPDSKMMATKIALFALSIVCLGFVVALGSRIIIVSVAILFLFYLILYIGKKRMIEGVFFLLLAGIGTLLAYQYTPSVRNRFSEVINTSSTPPLSKEEMNSTNIRIAVWQCTKEVIAAQNLVVGIGIGDVQHAMDNCFESHQWAKELYESKYNVHNQFLQTLIGIGGIGLAFLLTVYFYGIKNSITAKNPLLFSLMTLITLTSCTETVLGTQKGTVFCFFMLCLLCVGNLNENPSSDPDSR